MPGINILTLRDYSSSRSETYPFNPIYMESIDEDETDSDSRKFLVKIQVAGIEKVKAGHVGEKPSWILIRFTTAEGRNNFFSKLHGNGSASTTITAGTSVMPSTKE